jgi:hypothetical protein
MIITHNLHLGGKTTWLEIVLDAAALVIIFGVVWLMAVKK